MDAHRLEREEEFRKERQMLIMHRNAGDDAQRQHLLRRAMTAEATVARLEKELRIKSVEMNVRLSSTVESTNPSASLSHRSISPYTSVSAASEQSSSDSHTSEPTMLHSQVAPALEDLQQPQWNGDGKVSRASRPRIDASTKVEGGDIAFSPPHSNRPEPIRVPSADLCFDKAPDTITDEHYDLMNIKLRASGRPNSRLGQSMTPSSRSEPHAINQLDPHATVEATSQEADPSERAPRALRGVNNKANISGARGETGEVGGLFGRNKPINRRASRSPGDGQGLMGSMMLDVSSAATDPSTGNSPSWTPGTSNSSLSPWAEAPKFVRGPAGQPPDAAFIPPLKVFMSSLQRPVSTETVPASSSVEDVTSLASSSSSSVLA